MGLSLDINKLYEDLDYWIFIGIGDDIVKVKRSRLDYQALVTMAELRGISKDKIPRFVKLLIYLVKNKRIKAIRLLVLIKLYAFLFNA